MKIHDMDDVFPVDVIYIRSTPTFFTVTDPVVNFLKRRFFARNSSCRRSVSKIWSDRCLEDATAICYCYPFGMASSENVNKCTVSVRVFFVG